MASAINPAGAFLSRNYAGHILKVIVKHGQLNHIIHIADVHIGPDDDGQLAMRVCLKGIKDLDIFARWRQVKEIKYTRVLTGDPFGNGEQEHLIKFAKNDECKARFAAPFVQVGFRCFLLIIYFKIRSRSPAFTLVHCQVQVDIAIAIRNTDLRNCL